LTENLPWQLLPPRIPGFLRAQSAERDAREVEIGERFRSRNQAAETAFAEESASAQSRQTTESQAIASTHNQATQIANARREGELTATRTEHAQTRKRLLSQAKRLETESGERCEQIRWEATAMFEASHHGENQRHEQLLTAIAMEDEARADLRDHTDGLLRKYKRLVGTPVASKTAKVDLGTDALADLQSAVGDLDAALSATLRLRSPRFVSGANPLWMFVLLTLAMLLPAIAWLSILNGIILATASAFFITLTSCVLFWILARRRLASNVPRLIAAHAHAEALVEASRAMALKQHDDEKRRIVEHRDAQIQKADRSRAEAKTKAEQLRSEGLAKIDAEFQQKLADIEANAQGMLEAANAERARRTAELGKWYEGETRRIADDFARRKSEAAARRDRDWGAMLERWNAGLRLMAEACARIDQECAVRFFDWHASDKTWSPPIEVPPAVRFGSVNVELARIPHGPPRDAALRAASPDRFELPALLTFPDRASLLVRAKGAGREAGISALQATMLRFVTSLPPGKVRFTIIDPVGLGRHFAAFMHLADYSELLVNGRIWTEPQQIEQRLADLSLHMENVIQQFLRNEYANLEEYNRQAAEVAEPYRVLVVAHFPANFNDSSAQRLLSIMQGGARCGVHTLILIDEDQPIPSTVKLEDLQAHATTLQWSENHFDWRDADFAPFALRTDVMPGDERLTPLLHRVGEAARTAGKVEVPFEVIAPPRAAWWKGSTRSVIDVPLGRAGATKLQSLQLGKGTSQHVLIAGRTGSGKSTLLHALITNASLIYSPDELEFYLIDFKKGVEFQTYAEYELPHARVVAIESEREFGLSVLQRLDEELKRRGEAFRAAGVQDLSGYRVAPGVPPMPRALLVVDEFQEFFVEDDKLAQDASLLLDRLVRQGRAFGIHIHLGSQTLGGAYSLARTTLGQMAVRIALQCSESDAHLILSEDNSAARLLSRPGEAIYNDANGLVEGNHVFQVVWLPDSRREEYLKHIRELSRAPDAPARRSQIIFEGNIPSDLRRNERLRGLIEADTWPAGLKLATASLGEAVAIKDPTAASFRRQGGNNVLVIGQDAAAARGVFFASLFSLAAQLPPSKVRFFVLDGSTEDDADFELFARLVRPLPHGIVCGTARESAATLDELSEELKKRQAGVSGAASIFLYLFDVSRFRDLRKADDDFGFGRREDAKATPAQQLMELIREGPALGIHVIAWFDTLNNVQRVFDRSALREFESRVLFQMSANDSSTLVDSPLANRLGTHRGLFHSEDQGTLEKFRPYGIPPEEWVAEAGARLALRFDEA
jgi:ABC-type multidrug transport system fused ATPase/permease subunit